MRLARAGLVVSAGAMGLGAGPVAAAILLDDFEGGFVAMAGDLAGTGPAEAQRPGMQAGMRIDLAGQGACDHFTGASAALCGADTRKFAGQDGARLTYRVDFGAISGLLFDLAAFSDADAFDRHDEAQGDNDFGDYLRVSALIGGARTLLAEFTGQWRADRTPETKFSLVSTDAGALLGAGRVTRSAFETVALRGLKRRFDGTGKFAFEIRSTGSAEQIGLDNVRVAPAPLPGALAAALLGLTALGAMKRAQRS
jgi:hypothetical protein